MTGPVEVVLLAPVLEHPAPAIEMKKMAALADYKGAYKRWKDDVEIRFARAQELVAKAKYEKMLESNRLTEKAVTEVELNEAKLDWDHFKLAIEKSIHDQELAQFEALTKQAEYNAAELAIQRRTCSASTRCTSMARSSKANTIPTKFKAAMSPWRLSWLAAARLRSAVRS